MKLKENRMSSFVDRGNKLIAEGKTLEAMKLVENHYCPNCGYAVKGY